MSGMNASTGTTMPDELSHIQQSVADILTTPTGTRVMRREYGSFIPELIDQPLNGATLLRLYSATVMAILRWEPRITLNRVSAVLDTASPGALTLDINATRAGGQPFAFSVPLRAGAAT